MLKLFMDWISFLPAMITRLKNMCLSSHLSLGMSRPGCSKRDMERDLAKRKEVFGSKPLVRDLLGPDHSCSRSVSSSLEM